jgi:lipid II:glycine glycyltransferase (peptidoglycan interpeptide bridge formation enzyme)
MLSILTRQFLFKKNEIWFYKDAPVEHAAYTSYCYVIGKPPSKPDSTLNEFTTIIDLTGPEERLFNAINDTFRYHIRKAEALDLEYVHISKPSTEECFKVIQKFNAFAERKEILPMNKKRIFALQAMNHLYITKILQNNKTIATHVYLHDNERILLMHTFHDEPLQLTTLDGYANKYLHWKDILLFKEKGFKLYDFGGIDQKKLPGISNFKLSFGGKIESVNSYIKVSPFLKLLYKLLKK